MIDRNFCYIFLNNKYVTVLYEFYFYQKNKYYLILDISYKYFA